MTDLSPLQRKIGTPRPSDVPPPLTLDRVWRRAVQHGLVRAIGLEAVIGDVTCETILPDKISESVGEGDLCALLDGPLGYGLVVVSADLLGAMLEMMTLGAVRSRPLAARAVTATDAAMVADPLDRVLDDQQALVAELGGGAPAASGYRFATRVENLREIGLSLEDETHDIFTISLETGPRKGTLRVVLPRQKVTLVADGSSLDWSARMEHRLMGAEVPLRADLSYLKMAVSELQALAVGDTLALGRHSIDTVRLRGPSGEQVGVGKLGQSGGRKAVRIGVAPVIFSAAEVPKVAGIIAPAADDAPDAT